VNTAAATSVLPLAVACKGSNEDASLACGRHHYRVNTRGDRRRNRRANDRLVCSPYYPFHDERAAWIKGRYVDNAVGLDGRQQPELQSKLVQRQRQRLLCKRNIG